MNTITGLMHIHTTYSFDGRIAMDDLAASARERGHAFLLLTEHNNDFSQCKMDAFVEHCGRLSDSEFRIVPGLEIDCDFGRHLLAVGIRRFIPGGKPEEVARAIEDNGGLVILPHPSLYQFRSFIRNAKGLNGVEIWNSRYDSRHAPNLKSIELLENIRKENPLVFAYAGQDLHDRKDIDNLCLSADVTQVTDSEILGSLRCGQFSIFRKHTMIDATGSITSRQRLVFDIRSAAKLLKESLSRGIMSRSKLC